MKYTEAIKLPRGGAVAMDKNNLLATACEMVARRHCLRPEALYNWAIKFNVPIRERIHYFGNVSSNADLLEDILNDKHEKTMYIKSEMGWLRWRDLTKQQRIEVTERFGGKRKDITRGTFVTKKGQIIKYNK